MSIDRLLPTHRPKGHNAGTQRWRDLLFVHWPVPVEALRPLVPAALELDLYDDVAYIGVVPFAMEGVRPSWLPSLFAFNFLETNVRTYVHYQGRPGVYFFSLEAASWLAVQAARMGWGLPYYYAKMHMHRESEDVIAYRTVRSGQSTAQLQARFQIGPHLGASEPGSLEHFLLERYLLFSEHRGRLQEGQVYHTPYPAQHAEILELDEGLVAAAGLPQPEGPPPLVHYAAGVDVEVFALKPVSSSPAH